MTLFIRTLKASVIGLVVVGSVIFIPTGTFAYWQGWAFIAVFTASTVIIGLYLAIKDPALLERRIKAGPAAETRPAQKAIISLAFLSFFALAIVSVLDHRFGWSHVPAWVSVLGNILVALGLMIDLRVFRENSYGAGLDDRDDGRSGGGFYRALRRGAASDVCWRGHPGAGHAAGPWLVLGAAVHAD